MYFVPTAAILALALVAVAWSPFLALAVAVLLFLAFVAYMGLRPQPDGGRRR